jgi:hypothetical protein
MRRYAGATIFLIAIFLASPATTFAYPFGGMINQIIFCFNNAIYTSVGPPRGGPFIWTPSTRTYQFGPPMHTGQWLLGLVAPPYYCLVSIQPIIVWSGVLMTMEGSSGPSAPGSPGGGLGNSSGSGTGSGNSAGNGNALSGIGHVVISEVYYQADVAHGGAIEDQWVELYNGSSADVDISRWTIQSSSTSQTFPQGTSIAPNSYVLFAGTSSVRTLWTIPQTITLRVFPNAFAGFTASGDHVVLQNAAGTRVDAMSWGLDRSIFSPPAPTVQSGHSLIRKNLVSDTGLAQDWIDTPAPNPGR